MGWSEEGKNLFQGAKGKCNKFFLGPKGASFFFWHRPTGGTIDGYTLGKKKMILIAPLFRLLWGRDPVYMYSWTSEMVSGL